MIAATLAYLYLTFFTSGIFSGLDDRIETTVTDKQRQEVLQGVLDTLSDQLQDIEKETLDTLGNLEDTHRNFDSRPEDFDQAAAAMADQHQKMTDAILQARQGMVSNLSAEEWKVIFAVETPRP